MAMSEDGPKLGPPAKRPPPGGPPGGPPSPSKVDGVEPAPTPSDVYIPDDASLHEGSSLATWAVVAVLIALMIGVYFYVDPILNPHKYADAEVEEADQIEGDSKKTRKKRRKRKRRSSVEAFIASDGEERDRENPDDFYEDEEFWSDDELATNDRFQLGDVFAEEEQFVEETPDRAPEPEFVPPREMWQPEGPYTPTSAWSGPGANKGDVVEMSMTGSMASPLKPAQIHSALTVSRLMPCYRDIARKVPGMKGRVDLAIQVEPNGRVSKVRVKRSALRSKMVEDCIVSTTRKVRFPATDGRRTKFDTHFDFD